MDARLHGFVPAGGTDLLMWAGELRELAISVSAATQQVLAVASTRRYSVRSPQLAATADSVPGAAEQRGALHPTPRSLKQLLAMPAIGVGQAYYAGGMGRHATRVVCVSIRALTCHISCLTQPAWAQSTSTHRPDLWH